MTAAAVPGRSPGEHADVVEHRSSADYIDRTIATVRNHREADNCWPQWANVFADEIEDLRADVAALVAVAEDATRQAGELDENLGRVQTHLQHVVADRDRLRERVAELENVLRAIEAYYGERYREGDAAYQAAIIARAALSGGTAEGSTEETAA